MKRMMPPLGITQKEGKERMENHLKEEKKEKESLLNHLPKL
jgi:hypothetical protein